MLFRSNRLLYIGTNNYQAGKTLGKEMVKLLPHGGKIAVFVGTFSASLVGGVVSIGLLAAGRAGRKTPIPYGPYMIVGCWVGLVAGGAVTDWYLGFSGVS